MQSASHTVQQRGYKSLQLSIRGKDVSHTDANTQKHICPLVTRCVQKFTDFSHFIVQITSWRREHPVFDGLSCKVAARMDNLLSIYICLAAKEYPYSK